MPKKKYLFAATWSYTPSLISRGSGRKNWASKGNGTLRRSAILRTACDFT